MAETGAGLPIGTVVFVLILFLLVAGFGWALYVLLQGRRARLNRRIAHVTGNAGSGRGKTVRVGAAMKRRNIQSRLRQVEEKRSRKGRSRLRERLMQAGIRMEVSHYLALNAAIGAAAALVYLLSGMPRLGLVLVVPIVGMGLPRLVVGFRAKRRLGKFTKLFADALDIVVRGVRSGLPLGECINIIGREMPDPVGTEFRLIGEGQKLGLTLQEALDRAVDRTPTPELRFFATVLTIQQQTGGNLAETLAKLSEVLRSRKRMRDKIQAYASEARASAMIIGSLPIVVGAILGLVAPDYVGLLFTTSTGHLLTGIGLTIMGVGILVMSYMINFDI
jgi:tight adherence protein B